MRKNETVVFRLLIVGITLSLSMRGGGQNYPASTCTGADSVLCMSFELPENWKSQLSRKITIPVKIYRTKSQNPSIPIVWLSGGPGQTNLDYNPPSELLKNHDVILVGYRGVDGPVSLDCPEISKAFKGKGRDLLSRESIVNVREAARYCAGRLTDAGIDLNGYTIEQVLFDIDSVRRYLDLSEINLLSASYGTRVAQAYSKYYSQNINRSIMIGAGPPGRFVWEPELIDKKLGDYDALCQSDPYCSSRTEDLRKTFEKVLNEMPKRWLFIPIDVGKVKVVTFGMLYHKSSALQVIDSFLAADDGDYSGIALMSVAYNYILPKMMVWGDFLSKGMIDYDDSRNYWDEFTSSPYPLGSPMSALFMDIGELWPVIQPPSDFSKLDTLEVETLVLNGALDFSTPHENVQKELMPFLPNGELVVFNGAGHVADLLYKKDVKKGMGVYYERGEVKFKQFSKDIDFDIKNGFPKIAKISVGTVGIVLLGIAFGSYKLIKK